MTRLHQEWLNDAITNNEKVVLLFRALADSGCPFSSANVAVGPCNQQLGIAGGFHPSVGIRLCNENLPAKFVLEDTLTHELVHAYDWCTMKWNLTNLRHQACSEIRAGLISGECRLTLELLRGNIPSSIGQRRIESCAGALALSTDLAIPTWKVLRNSILFPINGLSVADNVLTPNYCQDCVKRRAVLSLMGNPNLQCRDEAIRIVDDVYPACSKDKTPF